MKELIIIFKNWRVVTLALLIAFLIGILVGCSSAGRAALEKSILKFEQTQEQIEVDLIESSSEILEEEAKSKAKKIKKAVRDEL